MHRNYIEIYIAASKPEVIATAITSNFNFTTETTIIYGTIYFKFRRTIFFYISATLQTSSATRK